MAAGVLLTLVDLLVDYAFIADLRGQLDAPGFEYEVEPNPAHGLAFADTVKLIVAIGAVPLACGLLLRWAAARVALAVLMVPYTLACVVACVESGLVFVVVLFLAPLGSSGGSTVGLGFGSTVIDIGLFALAVACLVLLLLPAAKRYATRTLGRRGIASG